MSYLESFILGLVQGLGEFLPISSSAHLVIAPWLGEFHDPGLAFDVALHFGTLIAVVAYFWRDWYLILAGAARFIKKRVPPGSSPDADARFYFFILIYLVLATVPAAVAGFALEDWASTKFRHPLLVAFTMAAMGAVLLLADGKKSRRRGFVDINLSTALIIGLAQALALVPGVSRSGITITAALLLGLDRSTSARFSFLLSTPIIFGACILKVDYLAQALSDPQALLGIATACIFGFLSIKYLMRLVQNYSYLIFVYYRFVFCAGVVLIYFFR